MVEKLAKPQSMTTFRFDTVLLNQDKNYSSMDEYKNFGFHITKELFFQKTENGIQISKCQEGPVQDFEQRKIIFTQIVDIDGLASALASCTTNGDNHETWQKFRDLLNS